MIPYRYLDENDVTISPEEIEKALRQPDNFGWFGDNDMFVTWALGPVIEHRDSDVLDRANAKALRNYLAEFPEIEGDWKITSCNHWAVGHVDHLSYRVVDGDGKPTRIARIVKAWFEYLRDVHPVADEDLLSETENEEANRVWAECYSPEERIKYIRRYRSQFDFNNLSDMIGCVRGKYFAGYASELVSR
jgi:hypothetical protein